MQTLPQTIETLRVLDVLAARKLWHQRMLGTFRLVAQPSTTTRAVVLDDASHTLHQRGIALILTYTEGDTTVISLHTRNAQTSIHADIKNGIWPAVVRDLLAANGVLHYTLLPFAFASIKNQHRHVSDVAGTHFATLTLRHGSIDSAYSATEVSQVSIAPLGDDSIQQIPVLSELIQRQVACGKADQTMQSMLVNASAPPSHAPSHTEYMTTHVQRLLATGRDADEAILIPISADDSPIDRLIVAAAIVQKTGHPANADPFWLVLDEAQRTLVTEITSCDGPIEASIALPPIDSRDFFFTDVLRSKLRAQFRRVLHREHAVAKGYHAEDVHRIRVSLRKLNSLLECGLNMYETEEIAQYRRGFRRMSRFLGEVRDADAFAAHVKRILGRNTVPHEIRTALHHIRQKALHELAALIEAEKHQQFLVGFAQFVCAPTPLGNDTQTVTAYLHHRVTQMMEALTKPMQTPATKLDTETLHDIRIQAKKLRYTIEAFPEIFLPDAQPLLSLLEKVQHRLGIIQDAATAHRILIDTHLTSHSHAKAVLTTLRAESNYQRTQLGTLWQSCLNIDTAALLRQVQVGFDQEGTTQ